MDVVVFLLVVLIKFSVVLKRLLSRNFEVSHIEKYLMNFENEFPLKNTVIQFLDMHMMLIAKIYIYKRLRPRKKNPQQKKRKSRKSNFFKMKFNTKPLKFKCGLEGGPVAGGVGWLVDPCKAWVPPPSAI